MGLILFALCLNFLSVLMETAKAGFSTAAPQCCFLGLFYFPGWVAVTDHSAAQQITAMSPLGDCPDTPISGMMSTLKPRVCPQRAICPAEPTLPARRELSRALCSSRGELYNCAPACVCFATALWGHLPTSRSEGKDNTTKQKAAAS